MVAALRGAAYINFLETFEIKGITKDEIAVAVSRQGSI